MNPASDEAAVIITTWRDFVRYRQAGYRDADNSVSIRRYTGLGRQGTSETWRIFPVSGFQTQLPKDQPKAGATSKSKCQKTR